MTRKMTGEKEAGVATVAAPTGRNSGPGRWGTLTWAGRTLVISIAIAMASLGVLMLVSLTWPRSWDASIMEYIAWLINQGARPYRDVFDMNFPGTYLFHTAGQRLTGTSDLGFRLRDVTVLLGALAVFYRLMRRFPWPTAPMAVMLLAVQYLVIAGASGSLQRDWLVAIGVLIRNCASAGRTSRVADAARWRGARCSGLRQAERRAHGFGRADCSLWHRAGHGAGATRWAPTGARSVGAPRSGAVGPGRDRGRRRRRRGPRLGGAGGWLV